MGNWPGMPAAMYSIPLFTAKLSTIPIILPDSIGSAQSTAASCIRQIRICTGVAPMLDNIPNWCTLAFIDTAKELWIIRIRDRETNDRITR